MRDAQLYFDEIVAPTIADFETNFTSRRHAYLACAALVHTLDYIAFADGKPRSKRVGVLRQQFAKNRHFLIVDRVAHAFKHVHSDGQTSIRNGGDKVTGLDVGHMMVIPRESNWSPTETIRRLNMIPVSVMTADGPVDLLATLHEAAAFIRERIEISNTGEEAG